jgi:hypothetical protein
MIGAWMRSYVEYLAGNYQKALELLVMVPFCEGNCNLLLSSHKNLGNEEQYQTLFSQRMSSIETNKAHNLNSSEYITNEMNLYIIDGQLDKAIELQRLLLEYQIPMEFEILGDWTYTNIHSHPKWPDLVELSNKIMEREKRIYLDMVAKESGNDKSKQTGIGKGT